jgi:hypothetical protein
MDTRLDRRQFVALAGAAVAEMATARAESETLGNAGAAYSFVVVADPHLAENREGEATGADKFRRVLEAVSALDPAPDFVLVAGDLHVDVLAELLPEIPVPAHVVAGNHENAKHRERLRGLFPDDFQGRDFYSFAHKGDLFIGMCNAAATDHVGHFETESNTPPVGQVEWVESELARRDQFARVFLFGHVPPEAACRPDPMCLAQNDARWLRDQVARTRPTALFFGHRHHMVTFAFEGVPVHGLRSCNWNFHNEPTGFTRVTLTPTTLDIDTIDTA